MEYPYLDCNTSITTTTEKNIYIPASFENKTLGQIEEIQFFFLMLVSPFLFIMGTVGNVCVICVMARKTFNKNPTSIFFKALAVTDILVLWIGLSRHLLIGIAKWDIRLHSEEACWWHTWLVYGLASTNNWILVSITATRFLYLRLNPFKVHRVCKRSVIYILVIIIATINLVIYLVVLFFKLEPVHEKDKSGRLRLCELKKEHEHDWYPIFHVFVYFYAPATCIIVLNWKVYSMHFEFLKRRQQLRLLSEKSSKGDPSPSPVISVTFHLPQKTSEEPVEPVDNIVKEKNSSESSTKRKSPPLTEVERPTMADQTQTRSNTYNTDSSNKKNPISPPKEKKKKWEPQVKIKSPPTIQPRHSQIQRESSQTMTGSGSGTRRSIGKAEQPIGGLLMMACAIFIVLNAPWSGYYVAYSFYLEPFPTPVGTAAWTLLHNVVNVLVFTNNAINFLVYVAFGERYQLIHGSFHDVRGLGNHSSSEQKRDLSRNRP